MKTFIAIDFETANEKRVSACSLGVAKVIDGVICDHKTYLIHPVGEYKPINIKIHGITPEKTAYAPTFDEIYPALRGEFESFPILSYTPFDRCVVEALTSYYGLEFSHEIQFYDVCALAKSRLAGLPDYKLPTVSKSLGLGGFAHHDAEADALQCAQVFLALTQDGDSLDELLFKPSTCNCNMHFHEDFWVLAKFLVQKGCVDEDDAYELQRFLDSVAGCSKLLRSVSDMVSIVLEDGVVTRRESDILLAMLSYALDYQSPSETKKDSPKKTNQPRYGVQELHRPPIDGLEIPEAYRPVVKDIPKHYRERWNYVANHPFTTLSGATIVITGEGEKISRFDAEKYARLLGADIKSGTTRNTDICVVLGEPPESCTTNKILRAREQKENGSSIVIIDEDAFIELLKTSIAENANNA